MDQSALSGLTLTESYPPRATGVYHPLKANQTRFLRIFPAKNRDDKIHTDLECVSLEDNNSISYYEALSYSWGTKEFTHSLWVENSQLKVTSNLFDALVHLRDKKKTRTLWVDAICINQEDKEERNQQVRYMKNIYSSVRHVIIWLGKEAEGPDSDLHHLSKQVKMLTAAGTQATTKALFQQPWWFRSWTVQEFLNAKSCIFVYGSMNLSWKDMPKIMDDLEKNSDGVNTYTDLYQYVRSKNSYGSDLLRTVMIDFGHCEASDPRDKVYAFLGISKDNEKVKPDYEASVSQVYTDVVKAYVEEEGNLEIICTHHRGYNLASLPSWVPDWSISRHPKHNWTVNNHGNSFYDAGYPRQNSFRLLGQTCPPVYGISFEGMDTLRVPGTTVGLISQMACSIDPGLFDTNQWTEAIVSWKAEFIESGKYISGESNFRALCRTLVGDVCTVLRIRSAKSKFLSNVEKDFRTIFKNHSKKPATPDFQKSAKYLRRHVQRATCYLKFARISSGHMALVPEASEVGDEICVLLGSSTPIVMRREPRPSPTKQDFPTNSSIPGEDSPVYRMIGPCYVHGVMDGEISVDISNSFVIR